jgi:hypothetical protein
MSHAEPPSPEPATAAAAANQPAASSAIVNAPPEVLDAPVPAVEGTVEPEETVTRPTKLIRIASMVRAMLEEVRRAPLDDEGRRALREIHDRSMRELESILSPDLQAELSEVALPLSSETPSESELRLAQAQLVGWLEGLFHGIQASLFAQQATAQSQLEEVRRRPALDAGPPMSGSAYL